jgi:pimeloyl-ACP methyl ester carboxylesterase
MSAKVRKCFTSTLWWVPRCLALAAVASGCSDTTVPTESRVKAPPMPAFAIVYDGQINQSDSYVAQDITSTQSAVLQFSTPTYDPAVDGMVYSMQLPTESESDHIEGGYGYDGTTRIHEYNWGGEDYNSGIASATIINDVITYYDASGNPMAPVDPTSFANLVGTSTINSIGSGPSGGGGGGGGYCPETDPSCQQQMMMNLVVGDGSSQGSAGLRRPSSETTADGGVLVTIPIEANGRRGELKKLYKKRDGQWLLLTEDEQTEETVGKMTLKSTVHREHTKYVFHVNKEKDKERAEWKKNHPDGSPARVAPALTLQSVLARADGQPAHTQLSAGAIPRPRADFYVDNGPGQGLVLVHGVKSDENTWFPRMEPWLTGSLSPYAFAKILAPSLNWREGISYQAADLQGRASVVGPNALFIGHSQGGLLSRKVGQANPGYPGSLVKGVVTIDSPHQGAVIAKVLNWVDYQNIVNALRSSAFVKYCQGNMIACILDAAAAQGTVDDITASYSPSNSSRDLQPNSAALQALNSTTERFLRGGVQNTIDGRFKWARLYGDKNHNPEEPWGGRHLQRITSEFFLKMRHCHNAWWFPGSSVCGVVYSAILHLDEAFERHIDPAHSGSDGIVTYPSQIYPNTYSTVGAPRNFRIKDGDSHVGALKTVAVREAILRQILPFYGLPTK